MLSDIENLDVMLGGNHFEREESVDSSLPRRPEIVLIATPPRIMRKTCN